MPGRTGAFHAVGVGGCFLVVKSLSLGFGMVITFLGWCKILQDRFLLFSLVLCVILTE